MPYKLKEDKAKCDRRRLIKFNKYVHAYKKNKCCSKCGYNKNPQILCFHHINPKDKNCDVSKIKKSYIKFNKEVKKCIVLCPNCHMELHLK